MDRPGVVEREPERYEPVDAPDAPTFPSAEPSYDGERGYEPIRPRSGFRELYGKRRSSRRARTQFSLTRVPESPMLEDPAQLAVVDQLRQRGIYARGELNVGQPHADHVRATR